MNINYIPIFGYSFLLIANLIFLKSNLIKNNLFLFGSLIILFNISVSLYEKINNLSIIVKPKQKLTHQPYKNNIIYSHLFLTIFYITTYLLPINQQGRATDIFGLIGHILNIQHNKYNYIGLLSLTIFYIIFIVINIIEIDLLHSKFQIVGGLFLLVHYIYRSYDNIKSINDDSKSINNNSKSINDDSKNK
jgi:hypothetical protein